MSVNYLLTVLNSPYTIADTDTFLSEGKRHWPDCKAKLAGSDTLKTDADIEVFSSGVMVLVP